VVQDSQASLERIRNMLVQPQVDYGALDSAVHQLKGSAASFGAHDVTNLCKQLRHAVQNHQGPAATQLVAQLVEARQALYVQLLAFTELEEQKKQLMAQA
jgi:HPt (histidine-containing phosphotransfer) domain-containing protein